VGCWGGSNLYRYAKNSSGWIDPLGLSPLALPAPTALDAWGSGAKLESMPVPKGGIIVEMAMSPGQTRPGGWPTLYHIPNVDYVRNELAVIPEFKPEISHVQRFYIPEGVQIQVGPVGPQTSGGKIYRGGGSQIQVLNYADRAKMRPIGKPRAIHSIGCGGQMNLIENYRTFDDLGSYDRDNNPLGLTVEQLAPKGASWSYKGVSHKFESSLGLIAIPLKDGSGIAFVIAPYNKKENKAIVINPDGTTMWDVSDMTKSACRDCMFSEVYYVLAELCFFISCNENDFRFSFDAKTGEAGKLIPSY